MRKLLLIACLITSSAALAGNATTPTGQAEAEWGNANLPDIEGKLAGTCMDKGFQITNQTPNQVTCQLPFSGFKQALAGALLGNMYSTPPNVYFQVNLAQIGPNVRGQAHAWMETQMAFGQTRRMDYNDAKSKSQMMTFLVAAGGQLPAGTTFDGSWIGVVNNVKTDTNVLNITHVFRGSPAEQAGLRVGDQITQIDGRSFKNQEQFDKIRDKIKDATFPLTFSRGGQSYTVNVQRRAIPAVGTPEYAALKAEADAYAKEHPAG